MFSTTTEYALRAVAALAHGRDKETVLARDLAAAADVPAHYLAKILAQLARVRVIRATRGAGGGYRLARPAGEIRLIEIVEPLEGVRAVPHCLFGGGRLCSDASPCSAHQAWRKARQAVVDFLQETTLADVTGGAGNGARPARRRRRRAPV